MDTGGALLASGIAVTVLFLAIVWVLLTPGADWLARRSKTGPPGPHSSADWDHGMVSRPIQCESSPARMSRRDSCRRDGSRGQMSR